MIMNGFVNATQFDNIFDQLIIPQANNLLSYRRGQIMKLIPGDVYAFS